MGKLTCRNLSHDSCMSFSAAGAASLGCSSGWALLQTRLRRTAAGTADTLATRHLCTDLCDMAVPVRVESILSEGSVVPKIRSA
jgi:hypothetical protein